jgi:hypothetical protein
MLLSFSFEEGLSHTFYPLSPANFTQNQNIIDWYITELKKGFRLLALNGSFSWLFYPFCLAVLAISLLCLARGFILNLLPQQGHGIPSGQLIYITKPAAFVPINITTKVGIRFMQYKPNTYAFTTSFYSQTLGFIALTS